MKKIRDYIEDNGLKVCSLAKKSGISRSSFYEIMDGKKIPTFKQAFRLEKATNGFVTVIDWVYHLSRLEDIADKKKQKKKKHETESKIKPFPESRA